MLDSVMNGNTDSDDGTFQCAIHTNTVCVGYNVDIENVERNSRHTNGSAY